MNTKVLDKSWLILGLVVFLCNCEKPNTSPIANFSFSPGTGNADTIFRFDASSSTDAEDDISVLQVHWDWTNDGIWDTDFSSNKVISHKFEEIKAYTVVMEIKDSKGLVNSISKTIPVSPSLPTVVTGNIANIKSHSAEVVGNVSKDGGAPVTNRGICWNTIENPTIANNTISGGGGIGDYGGVIDNLTKNTTYFARAFATNISGTSYGDQISFTTLNATVPIITTSEISNILGNTATGGGNISSDGGADIISKGVCWSLYPSPTISDYKTDDGTGTGAFNSNLTKLILNNVYYVRAYAINSEGITYGQQVNFKSAYVVPGMVAYWTFEDNANDQIGTYNPNANGVVAITYTASRNAAAGKAATFNGTSSIIEIPNGDALIKTADFTLSFWVKAATQSKGHFVMGLGAFYGFQFEIAGDFSNCKLAGRYDVGGRKSTAEDLWFPGDGKYRDNGGWQGWTFCKDLTNSGGVAGLLQDKWAQVVCAYNHSTKVGTMYINGEKMKAQDFNLWPDGDDKRSVTGMTYAGVAPDVVNELAFGFVQSRAGTLWDNEAWGGYDFPGSNHFQGQLDDIRIFHRTLTGEEIQSMYNSEK